MTTVFGMTSQRKKGLHVIVHTLGVIFARIFKDFAKAFTDFVQICADFARIFTKSKLLWVRLHPLHPRLLHH